MQITSWIERSGLFCLCKNIKKNICKKDNRDLKDKYSNNCLSVYGIKSIGIALNKRNRD